MSFEVERPHELKINRVNLLQNSFDNLLEDNYETTFYGRRTEIIDSTILDSSFKNPSVKSADPLKLPYTVIFRSDSNPFYTVEDLYPNGGPMQEVKEDYSEELPGIFTNMYRFKAGKLETNTMPTPKDLTDNTDIHILKQPKWSEITTEELDTLLFRFNNDHWQARPSYRDMSKSSHDLNASIFNKVKKLGNKVLRSLGNVSPLFY